MIFSSCWKKSATSPPLWLTPGDSSSFVVDFLFCDQAASEPPQKPQTHRTPERFWQPPPPSRSVSDPMHEPLLWARHSAQPGGQLGKHQLSQCWQLIRETQNACGNAAWSLSCCGWRQQPNQVWRIREASWKWHVSSQDEQDPADDLPLTPSPAPGVQTLHFPGSKGPWHGASSSLSFPSRPCVSPVPPSPPSKCKKALSHDVLSPL